MHVAECDGAITLDLSGLLCPFPMLKTRKALGELELGCKLHVVVTDPNTVDDFSALEKRGVVIVIKKWKSDIKYHFVMQRL